MFSSAGVSNKCDDRRGETWEANSSQEVGRDGGGAQGKERFLAKTSTDWLFAAVGSVGKSHGPGEGQSIFIAESVKIFFQTLDQLKADNARLRQENEALIRAMTQYQHQSKHHHKWIDCNLPVIILST